MSAFPACACVGDHCVTCSDEAVPMTVVRVDERRGLALCDSSDGTRHTVEIALLEDAAAGAMILVHAGVAIVALDGGGAAP